MSKQKSSNPVVGPSTAAAPALPERQRTAWRSYLMYLTSDDAPRVAAVMQDVMHEAQSSGRGEFREDPLVWVFREGRRAIMDSGQRPDVTAAGNAEDNVPAEGEDLRVVVHQSIQRLTPKQQEAVRLKFQFGFNLEEIARITGLTHYGAGGLLHLAVSRVGRAICTSSGSEAPRIDDQRLTAYALDELDDDEQKAFTEGMPNGKALFEGAETIRGWCGHIGQVLESGAQLPKRRRKGASWWKAKSLWFGVAALVLVGGGVYFFKPESEAVRQNRISSGANGIGSMRKDSERSRDRLSGAVGDRVTVGPLVSAGVRESRDRREDWETKPFGQGKGSAAGNLGGGAAASPGFFGTDGAAVGKPEAKSRGAPTGESSKQKNPVEARGESGEIEQTENEPAELPAEAKEVSPEGELEASPVAESETMVAPQNEAKSVRHRPGAEHDKTVEAHETEEQETANRNPEANLPPWKPGLKAMKRPAPPKKWPKAAEVSAAELLKHVPPPASAPAQAEALEAELEQAPSPWDPTKRIVRVSLRAKDVPTASRPMANLVFAIDVSQSMAGQNRLRLVEEAVRRLVDRLRPDDRVSVVTYADMAAVALPVTDVANASALRKCLAALETSGLTNGSEGLLLAYAAVRQGWIEGGLNEVVLCTDGNFNLGETGEVALAALAAEQAQRGVRLSVFGFGRSDRNDLRLEMLAQSGGGRSSYVNTREEAEQQLVEQINGLFAPVATDVAMKVEFNPALVAIARRLDEEPDKHEATVGLLLPGRKLSAVYEVTPMPEVTVGKGALASLRVGYALPGSPEREEQDLALNGVVKEWAVTEPDFRFVTAVLELARILRGEPDAAGPKLSRLENWVQATLPDDSGGYLNEIQYALDQAKLAAGN